MPRGSDKPLAFNAEVEPLKKRWFTLLLNSFGGLPEVVSVSNKDSLEL